MKRLYGTIESYTNWDKGWLLIGIIDSLLLGIKIGWITFKVKVDWESNDVLEVSCKKKINMGRHKRKKIFIKNNVLRYIGSTRWGQINIAFILIIIIQKQIEDWK